LSETTERADRVLHEISSEAHTWRDGEYASVTYDDLLRVLDVAFAAVRCVRGPEFEGAPWWAVYEGPDKGIEWRCVSCWAHSGSGRAQPEDIAHADDCAAVALDAAVAAIAALAEDSEPLRLGGGR